MKRRRARDGDPRQLGQATCPDCGKRRYLTRVDAKRAARALSPAEPLRAYLCGTSWHIGHNPGWRVRGEQL